MTPENTILVTMRNNGQMWIANCCGCKSTTTGNAEWAARVAAKKHLDKLAAMVGERSVELFEFELKPGPDSFTAIIPQRLCTLMEGAVR